MDTLSSPRILFRDSGWRDPHSLNALLKAYPPLEHAHALLLWDAETFLKRMPQSGDEGSTKTPSRHATLPAGARWITVHPGGNKDGKGIPVLVQETRHGSGVFHVIGGAGGKLNYLKMRGLKSEQDYKTHAAEKRKTKQALDQQRRERDRAAGLDTSKTREKDAVKQRQHADERGKVYTPTELGKLLDPPLSAVKLNLALEAAGLQKKEMGGWLPCDDADGLFEWSDTGKKHSSGLPVKQLRWFRAVLERLPGAQRAAA